MKEKVVTASEAVNVIRSGSSLAIGGNTLRRHPMVLIREIVRQRIKDLTIYAWVAGIDVDLLVGAGCVRRVEAAYIGMGPFGLAPNLRRAVEEGRIEIEDFSETSMMDRFRAAGMGLPFLPTRALAGTGIAEHASHVKPITCPFTGKFLHAVAAAKADVAILHGYYSDPYGNVQWPIVHSTEDIDRILAKSADKVIVSVEQIINPQTVLSASTQTYLPHYWVSAVVEAPFGAHPGSCDVFYDADMCHIERYMKASRSGLISKYTWKTTYLGRQMSGNTWRRQPAWLVC